MSRRIFTVALTIALAASATACKKSNDNGGGNNGDLRTMVTVFVGASITEGWDFSHYFSGYNFRKVIHYDWDKNQVWNEISRLDPAIVLVKECAAYFYDGGGTPLDEYEASIAQLVSRIRGIGAIPVLCTVLPVDVGYGGCTQQQLGDINAFNSWIRSYCSGQGIALMDYCTSIADSQGELPSGCHDGDGLHPNEAGYGVISAIVIPGLQAALQQ